MRSLTKASGIATAMPPGRRTRSHQRIREGSSMGQKTVRFSDLSGQLIMHDDALARIVVHEHPELGDGPVEIEALTEEAEAMEQAALRVAVIDLYLPTTSSRAASSWRLTPSTSWPRRTRWTSCSPPPGRPGAARDHRPTAAHAGTAWTTRPASTRASRTRARSPTPRSNWSATISMRSTSGWPARDCGRSASPTPSMSSATACSSWPGSATSSSSSSSAARTRTRVQPGVKSG